MIADMESIFDDWDCYEALKPTQEAIDNARLFLKLLPPDKQEPNKVLPDGDEENGGVCFRWEILNCVSFWL